MVCNFVSEPFILLFLWQFCWFLSHLLICIKWKESEVAQSCPTLCDSWTVAYQALPSEEFSKQEYWSGLPFPSPEPFPSSQPRDRTQVSCIAGRRFTIWATWEALSEQKNKKLNFFCLYFYKQYFFFLLKMIRNFLGGKIFPWKFPTLSLIWRFFSLCFVSITF